MTSPDISALVGRLRHWINVPRTGKWPVDRLLDDDIEDAIQALRALEAERDRTQWRLNMELEKEPEVYQLRAQNAELQRQLDLRGEWLFNPTDEMLNAACKPQSMGDEEISLDDMRLKWQAAVAQIRK